MSLGLLMCDFWAMTLTSSDRPPLPPLPPSAIFAANWPLPAALTESAKPPLPPVPPIDCATIADELCPLVPIEPVLFTIALFASAPFEPAPPKLKPTELPPKISAAPAKPPLPPSPPID